MAKYKATKQSANPVRKISKLGKYSYSITVPKGLIKKLGWKEKQKVVVKIFGNGLRIKDWDSKK